MVIVRVINKMSVKRSKFVYNTIKATQRIKKSFTALFPKKKETFQAAEDGNEMCHIDSQVRIFWAIFHFVQKYYW